VKGDFYKQKGQRNDYKRAFYKLIENLLLNSKIFKNIQAKILLLIYLILIVFLFPFCVTLTVALDVVVAARADTAGRDEDDTAGRAATLGRDDEDDDDDDDDDATGMDALETLIGVLGTGGKLSRESRVPRTLPRAIKGRPKRISKTPRKPLPPRVSSYPPTPARVKPGRMKLEGDVLRSPVNTGRRAGAGSIRRGARPTSVSLFFTNRGSKFNLSIRGRSFSTLANVKPFASRASRRPESAVAVRSFKARIRSIISYLLPPTRRAFSS